jgi:hypothetical protein
MRDGVQVGATSVVHVDATIDGIGGSVTSRNASRPPGHWQSYHIWFRAPRFDASSRKTGNARIVRVLHNGLSVQEYVEIEGPPRVHMSHPEASENPLMPQGNHEPIAFRNVHVRPYARSSSASETSKLMLHTTSPQLVVIALSAYMIAIGLPALGADASLPSEVLSLETTNGQVDNTAQMTHARLDP